VNPHPCCRKTAKSQLGSFSDWPWKTPAHCFFNYSSSIGKSMIDWHCYLECDRVFLEGNFCRFVWKDILRQTSYWLWSCLVCLTWTVSRDSKHSLKDWLFAGDKKKRWEPWTSENNFPLNITPNQLLVCQSLYFEVDNCVNHSFRSVCDSRDIFRWNDFSIERHETGLRDFLECWVQVSRQVNEIQRENKLSERASYHLIDKTWYKTFKALTIWLWRQSRQTSLVLSLDTL
jgi:hypothetical protein